MAGPDRPLLLLDVDGVLVIYLPVLGDDGLPWLEDGEIWGYETRLKPEAAELIGRLVPAFDIVWNTRWGQGANRVLVAPLGMSELPVIDLTGVACRHTKLPAVREAIGGRAMAWIDDELDDEVHAWARERAAGEAPTLLVHTEGAVGITSEHVDRLLAFAASLEG